MYLEVLLQLWALPLWLGDVVHSLNLPVQVERLSVQETLTSVQRKSS